MKSKAAIGNHPIHPMVVPVPIGAFVLALIGDVAQTRTADVFWYRFSFVCIGIGIVSALLAAVFGIVEYFGVKMSAKGGRIATWHGVLNVTAVVLYLVSFLVRRHDAALHNERWPLAMGTALVAFVILGVSGWLGGKLSFEHKVGVVESLDPEATEIGRREVPG
jgi:uncharacterized membrane protein